MTDDAESASNADDERAVHAADESDVRTAHEGDAHAADAEHFVYVLQCADDSLYTGYTTDVERRVAEHDAGEGAKYTRGRTPVALVHVEAFAERSAAMAREHEIKTLSRRAKLRLVRDGDP